MICEHFPMFSRDSNNNLGVNYYLQMGSSFPKIMKTESTLKAVCHVFDWVIITIQRIGNLNGCKSSDFLRP